MQHEPQGALPVKDLVSVAHPESDDIRQIFATARKVSRAPSIGT